MPVNSFDQEMADLAAKQAKIESKSLGGGNRISTKAAKFTIDDVVVPGGKFNAVVVDAVKCNAFYPEDYDDSKFVPPACYAFGDDESEMAPHDECEAPQHEGCAGCPMNVFGTASKGKGKACKNQRALALILEDNLEDENPPLYILNLAPTSTQNWAAYVSQVASAYKRPTCGVLTEFTIAAPKGKVYGVISEAFERKLEQNELAAVLPRRDEARALLTTPFPKAEEEEEKPKKNVKKPTPKPASRKFVRGGK